MKFSVSSRDCIECRHYAKIASSLQQCQPSLIDGRIKSEGALMKFAKALLTAANIARPPKTPE